MDTFDSVNKVRSRSKLGLFIGILFIAGVLLTGTVLAVRLVTGHGLGLRSLPRNMISLVRAVSNQGLVALYNKGEYTDIIFLHHSTGNNLVEIGNVRQLLSQNGYSFWDQSYNYQGLRDPNGNLLGYAYTVPRDNTDPDGLARVFSQKVYDQPINALSGLLQHEVIIVKSCFAPANQISSDSQLEQLKQYYLGIRESMSKHSEKVFILLTTPPLNPAETNPEEAARARVLADWLMSDDFTQGLQNIFVFDFFSSLAINDPTSPEYNMLREEYRWGTDSHPNYTANEEIAPIFVDFVVQAIQEYKSIQAQ